MKVVAMTDSGRVEVELRTTDLPELRASVDGRAYSILLQEVEPGVYWVSRDGRSVELVATAVDGGYEIRVGHHWLPVRILDRRAILTGRQVEGKSARSEVRAPMPGRVVRILVTPGAAVEHEQGLIVVEAMKMQNEIRSAGAGRIEKIAVSEGQAVNAGDLLMVVGESLGD